MFTDQDIQQIKNHGLTLEEVKIQVKNITSGIPYSNLLEAAIVGNGIIKITSEKQQKYIDAFEANRNQITICKFVPASGAATRMFHFLFQFLNEFDEKQDSIASYLEKNKDFSVFLENLEKFPFFDIVREKIIECHPDFDALTLGKKSVLFVKTMLDANQLNYSFYPKALLPFHKYGKTVSTAFQEHLLESTMYAKVQDKADLHFTISEEHTDLFKTELQSIKKKLEKDTNTTFKLSFSHQNKATDTIAITSKNELFKSKEGKLVFRQSGHGALIKNLNTLDYDVIFIKNIDNIAVAKKNIAISNYKKMLGGILLQKQQQTFKYLQRLDDPEISEDELNNIKLFIINQLNIDINDTYLNFTLEEKKTFLHSKLNRPIRVCGMVKNEGEPGGGPFWVKHFSGTVSLQIVEFAQIDFENEQQKNIVNGATHFNPTDLVCGVKNYKGEKFDLTKYVDSDAAFITKKSQNATTIKAFELPGLWNGSMAYWNSIFVEIPVSCFNPVKTLNDLLKLAHQD